MNRELSWGTVVSILAVVLLLIIGAWFLYEGKRRQQAQEIEKIIQRGVGAPSPAPGTGKP